MDCSYLNEKQTKKSGRPIKRNTDEKVSKQRKIEDVQVHHSITLWFMIGDFFQILSKVILRALEKIFKMR